MNQNKKPRELATQNVDSDSNPHSPSEDLREANKLSSSKYMVSKPSSSKPPSHLPSRKPSSSKPPSRLSSRVLGSSENIGDTHKILMYSITEEEYESDYEMYKTQSDHDVLAPGTGKGLLLSSTGDPLLPAIDFASSPVANVKIPLAVTPRNLAGSPSEQSLISPSHTPSITPLSSREPRVSDFLNPTDIGGKSDIESDSEDQSCSRLSADLSMESLPSALGLRFKKRRKKGEPEEKIFDPDDSDNYLPNLQQNPALSIEMFDHSDNDALAQQIRHVDNQQRVSDINFPPAALSGSLQYNLSTDPGYSEDTLQYCEVTIPDSDCFIPTKRERANSNVSNLDVQVSRTPSRYAPPSPGSSPQHSPRFGPGLSPRQSSIRLRNSWAMNESEFRLDSQRESIRSEKPATNGVLAVSSFMSPTMVPASININMDDSLTEYQRIILDVLVDVFGIGNEPICRTISTFLDENALGDIQSDEMFSDSISDSDQEFIEMGVMLATELDSLGISRASSAMSSVSPTDWDSKQLESMGSGLLILKNAISKSPTNHEISSRSVDVNHRQEIVRGLIQTEREYHSKLVKLRELREQLQDQMNHNDWRILFPPQLMLMDHFHKALCDDLLKEIDDSKWHPNDTTTIGKTFMQYIHYFHLYKFHIANHQRAIAHLDGDMKRRHAQEPFNQLDLAALLMSPVKRLSQYKAFMENLEKETDERHDDYYYIIQAITAMKETIDDVNNAIQERDATMAGIESKFVGKPKLCEPHRRFLIQMECEKWCVSLNRWKGYTIFLFNDLFVYARMGFRGYKLHQKIPISESFTCTYKSDGFFEISNHKLRKRPFKFRGKNIDVVIDFLEKLREQMREFTATKIQRLEISSPAPEAIYDLLFSNVRFSAFRPYRAKILEKYPIPHDLINMDADVLIREYLPVKRTLVVDFLKLCSELCVDPPERDHNSLVARPSLGGDVMPDVFSTSSNEVC